MRIDARLLARATGCSDAHARLYADWLDESAHRWQIDTPVRVASWLAQLAHESMRFTRVEESLNYTTPARLIAVWPARFRLPVTQREEPLDTFGDGKRNARRYLRQPERLANYVYASRMGNGNEDSGDGWQFRGRGLIQLSGRANYAAYQADSLLPALIDPALVASPHGATDSAGWFWWRNGLNAYADAGDWLGLTRKVNGGTHGIAERRAMTIAALEAAGVVA